MTPTPIPPDTRLRGSDRNDFGRTAPHPDAPKFRDPTARKLKAKRRTIDLPKDVRRAVERQAITAHLSRTDPGWVAGEVVTVLRRWRTVYLPEEQNVPQERKTRDRDAELAVEIVSVDHLAVSEVTAEVAHRLGFDRLGAFARDWYSSDRHPMVLTEQLSRDDTPIWLSLWTVNTDVAPRWLARGIVRQGGEPYPTSAARGIADAGPAVPKAYQTYLSGKAQPSITGAAERRARAARVAHAKATTSMSMARRNQRIKRAAERSDKREDA